MTLAATLLLVGRVVLGLFFVIAGIRNFLRFADRASPATNYGWKLPTPLTALGYGAQLVGGLSVTFGVLTVWGAALLIVFLVAATSLFHNFLMFRGEERQPHIYFTLVNCALVGYCLTAMATAL
ncbi:MAG: DoxX family protein [Bauldia sp.]